jgi:hypothetical protein
MEALTNEQRKNQSVGAIAGCITHVVDAKRSGELEYLQSVESTLSPEEGHSGYTILASNSGITRGIGIYYRSGKIGFLFIAGDLERCRKERVETVEAFIHVAVAKYGLNLQGGMW